MDHTHSYTERHHRPRHSDFKARVIGDNPALMDQSHRLRYQVYCVERGYLSPEDYPDQREVDEFDGDSVHVGAVDPHGMLAGTARVVKPNRLGFPMFRYCTLFPHVRALDEPGHVVVEASRISISRHYSAPQQGRRQRTEPFLTLVKAVMQAAKLAGATHLIGATDAAFHRWIVHYGMPFRVSGPEVDYYGPVVPSVMSLLELDEVILSGKFRALDGFPVGWDPSLWPGHDGHAGSGANMPADGSGSSVGQSVHA